VIPEGEYGGGTVMIWDKGVWAPDAGNRLGGEDDVDRQIKKGELKFVLLGEKLAGSWVLVRTHGTRQWLLIKHRDQYASDEDITVTKPLSVVSGRTMAQIARAARATPHQIAQAAGADPPSIAAGGNGPPAGTAAPRKATQKPGRPAARPRARR
jgi:bifunctional non-homologous end joining protein LigD